MPEGLWYQRPGRRFHITLECGHGYVSANPIYPGAPYLCSRCKSEGVNPSVMEVTDVVIALPDSTEETESGN